MFPNVRLLVGALFASVVALTCGFGLFAAFRVNHEPLSRLPVGTAPIQFVANERTGWGTPFDGQSRLNGPPHSAIAMDTPAAAPAHQMKAEAVSTATAEAIRPVVAAIPVIDTAPPRVTGQPAEVIEPIVSITPAAPAPSVAPNQTASAQSPSADTASPPATANSSAGAGAAQPTGTIAATPSAQPSESEPQAGSGAPVVAEPSSAKPAEVEAAAKPDSDTGAAVDAAAPAIAAATPSDQPSAVAPPASEAEPAPDTVTASATPEEPVGKIEAKKDGKITRKPVARRRIVVRRRVVRRIRPSPTQNTGFGDPVFRSAPNYSSASAYRTPISASNW